MVQYPESYDELTTYLNSLTAVAWKQVLRSKRYYGDVGVIRYLREIASGSLRLWSNEELLKYLQAHDLNEFEPVEGRW